MAETARKIRRLRKGRCTAILVIIFMVLMLFLGSSNKAAGADANRPMDSITVSQGDTLWGLVQEHYAYKGDIRQAIYEVKQINELADVNIRPGQILHIPRE